MWLACCEGLRKHIFAVPRSHGLLRILGLLIIFLSLMASPLWAKRKDDLVVLKNGDHITGEIKRIEHGTLYFKPDYALSDIQIDWTKVERLESKDRFNVGLTSGTVHTGLIERKPPSNEDREDFSISMAEAVVRTKGSEVVRLQPMENSLWNQLTGAVDYGFSFTSGNTQTQSSLGANVAYRGEKNELSGSLSSNFSGQSNGTNTTRESFTGEYARRLSEKWFASFLASLLSSSQQELVLRTTLGGALGRTLVQTDRTRFVAFGGAVVSRERYTPESGLEPLSTSAEALLGLDFSNFRFKLFDLTSRLLFYPSLSTPGRFRLGSESNVSWEFLRNLYWNLRIYENFDSKPPVNAPRNDFGVTTSVGWKF